MMKRIEALVWLILPDYKRRHVFTTKLRLVAFVGFWVIYIYFLRDVLGQTKVVAAVVLTSFLLIGVAYYNIIREKWLIPSFAVELISDLTAITAIIYLTGGPHSPYYTIYIFYALIAGILYNHYLAGVVAACSALYYGAFILLCRQGIIPPLILDYGDRLPIPAYTPFAHFLFAAIFLGGIVYTVKVASFFSQQREHELERRNRELMALHHMSSTVRSVTSLNEVVDKLLSGVVGGLGFETAVLVVFDWAGDKARIHVPGGHPQIREVEEVVGRPIKGIEFPLSELDSPVMQEIKRHRIVFRRDIAELVEGLGGLVSFDVCRRIQELLGVRRAVVMPIVVGDEALGALIGFSQEPFVGDGLVQTLESFANQSALSLEAATLIDRLRRVNEQLKEANEVKSEFLATMSHELRTPLTAIIGFSELLREGVMGELSLEQKEALGEVLANAADLLDMINSLLDLAKVESGKMRLNVREFNVAGTVRRVLSTISPLIQRKEQHLDLRIPEEALTIRGDEKKIQQAILNLVANANKFALEGGRISVAIRNYDSWDDIQVNAPWWRRLEGLSEKYRTGGLEINVSDNGVGIEEEHLESVFEMFHQADSSMTRSFGGTGLGLALTRKFVELHHGRIWAESEFGQGASFTIVLPRAGVLDDSL